MQVDDDNEEYKINMQRCPYIHEMKERLLGEHPIPVEQIQPMNQKKIGSSSDEDGKKMDQQSGGATVVGTVVKLNSDGYGSHTSPTHLRADRTPLMTYKPPFNKDHQDDEGDEDDFSLYHPHNKKIYPKNAKTSLFIIMSFVYAKLLVVVCIAYVISDVVTHNIPLYYYEGFFTYLYGMSILFLLYVFCFLLQESSCCIGQDENNKEIIKKVESPKTPKPNKKSSSIKDKEVKKEEEKKKKENEEKKKAEKEQKKKEEKEKKINKEKEKKNKKQDKGPQQQQQQLHPSAGAAAAAAAEGSGAPPAPPVPPPQSSIINNVVDVETGTMAIMDSGADHPLQPHQHQQQNNKGRCKRKTTQNDHSHGSFFLRIGAIAFGLGTMIYNGLEFGVFFEIPFNSPCYMILRGINPLLQMIFTFMQMYFIFMNSRLNIHRFKVVARFGLMHVVATNLCVWIRTLVLEYIKEITNYHRDLLLLNDPIATLSSSAAAAASKIAPFAESVRQHTLRNANTVLGTNLAHPDVLPPRTTSTLTSLLKTTAASSIPYFNDVKKRFMSDSTTSTTSRSSAYLNKIFTLATTKLPSTTTARNIFSTARTFPTEIWRTAAPFVNPTTTTIIAPSTTTLFTTTTTKNTKFIPSSAWTHYYSSTTAKAAINWPTISTIAPSSAPAAAASTYASFRDIFDLRSFNNLISNDVANAVNEPEIANESILLGHSAEESLDSLTPQAFIRYFSNLTTMNISANSSNDTCGRNNIMGSIVQDSAPYLFPFIIEYSLIGAAVIYCIWKHIGRYPRYVTQEDLEHRLEIMLSRRAVAMAQVQQGRVDCVGASKGLFFGLLMLVASLICLILFFVLIHHRDLGLLAIYLADVSHCVLMVLSIIAIIIGFIRIQGLKFKTEEQSHLNDILLRVSAFGLFLYATFSVIAGHLKAFTVEPNMLVMITGILAILQVILQLLFISDVSRRRVHIPEHDRTKPGRQIVTFLLICNITMWIIYTFETQKVEANPVQKRFYGFLTWAIVQRFTLPLCIFHRFHSAVTLAEIWKTTYKARLE